MSAQDFVVEGILTDDRVRAVLTGALERQFTNQRVLVLIPDHTRTIPLPFLFREIAGLLDDTQQLDFMVALGTHPPLTDTQLCELVGITAEERQGIYKHVGVMNHAWERPDTLVSIGTSSDGAPESNATLVSLSR